MLGRMHQSLLVEIQPSYQAYKNVFISIKVKLLNKYYFLLASGTKRHQTDPEVETFQTVTEP